MLTQGRISRITQCDETKRIVMKVVVHKFAYKSCHDLMNNEWKQYLRENPRDGLS